MKSPTTGAAINWINIETVSYTHLDVYKRQTFDSEEEQREQMADKTLETLNHCFEFLESAFGESQEMAVFVTELNSSVYSIAFLRENDCAMYYKYNKGLLLDERREEILEQMDAVENVVERGLVED